MDNASIIDRALSMLGDDMDDIEGKSAMAHGLEDCPDPLTCQMHEDETGDSMTGLDKPAVTIEVHGAGISPADEGNLDKGDGLKDDEAEELKKLLG